ncbi:hypothetical protein Tco_0677193 [Tanacetum coccineum]
MIVSTREYHEFSKSRHCYFDVIILLVDRTVIRINCVKHIDLWVDYMWHGRPDNANWAMVSCYFVQILLQNNMPLFYANGDKYATPWSDVDQDYELEKCRELMKSISETQLKVLKKISFIAKLHRSDLQHKIIQQVQVHGLLLPEKGNTFHNSRALVMLCFIDYLLPCTETCMDFPHNLQKSLGNAIVPIHLSVIIIVHIIDRLVELDVSRSSPRGD